MLQENNKIAHLLDLDLKPNLALITALEAIFVSDSWLWITGHIEHWKFRENQ